MTQREVGDPETGADSISFSAGLKEALRQSPNGIVVGEIRDAETANTVLRAAESGHYVMATIHARNATGAIQKMLSFLPGEEKTEQCPYQTRFAACWLKPLRHRSMVNASSRLLK